MPHDYNKYPELTNKQMETEQFSSPHQQITEDFDADVIKVHDGDTITLRTNFRDFDFPLRFAKIDAPEMNDGGEEAREWLKTQIEGQKIQVKINRNNRVGKYGRLLGTVVSNGLDMGETMLGLGLVKTFGSKNEGEVPQMEKIFRLKQWF